METCTNTSCITTRNNGLSCIGIGKTLRSIFILFVHARGLRQDHDGEGEFSGKTSLSTGHVLQLQNLCHGDCLVWTVETFILSNDGSYLWCHVVTVDQPHDDGVMKIQISRRWSKGS